MKSVKRKKLTEGDRLLRALDLAKILFSDEGYHDRYLDEARKTLEKIREVRNWYAIKQIQT